MSLLRVRTQIEQQSGGPGLATMWFTGSDQTAADDAAAAVRTFWDTIKAKISSGTAMQVLPEVTEVDLATGDAIGVFFVEAAIVAGTASGDVLPYTTQGLVSWRTGTFVEGRELRGRTFIPTPVEADNVGGFPLTSYSTAIAIAANSLAGSTALEVYSRTHHAQADVISASCWNNWAELRTRRN